MKYINFEVYPGGKAGLHALFPEWVVTAIEYMNERRSDFTSRLVHEAILEAGTKVSRASVIMLLQFLSEVGFLNEDIVMGKGGQAGLYSLNMDMDATEWFMKYTRTKFMNWVAAG